MDSKLFDQCPNCGSKETMGETLTKEAQAKGHASLTWRFAPFAESRVIVDQSQDNKIPVGAEAITVQFILDICIDCGTVYAKKINIGKVKKTVTMRRPNPGDRKSVV
jgi:uncharacterized Zn finger protein